METTKRKQMRTIYVPLTAEICEQLEHLAERGERSLGRQAALAIREWLTAQDKQSAARSAIDGRVERAERDARR